jgi:hypothetical protein
VCVYFCSVEHDRLIIVVMLGKLGMKFFTICCLGLLSIKSRDYDEVTVWIAQDAIQ